jgi:hypothetical protein
MWSWHVVTLTEVEMVSREMHVVRLSLDPEAEKRYSAMDSWESDHGTLERRF